jgi:hypothetical protein
MSINALNYAMHGVVLPPLPKLVFIFFGDCADDFGDSIFPSLDRLGRKTGIPRKRLKRTLVWLLQHEHVVMVAKATPVSPAFYRMVGVPDPDKLTRPKDGFCPTPLRRAVIHSFDCCCEVCRRHGLGELGPDGRPWDILRLDPEKPGGGYVPENVTLACSTCARRKSTPRTGLRSLRQRQQEPAHAGGRGQIDPPGRGQFGPEEGSFWPGGGVKLTPELNNELFKELSKERAGAAPHEHPAEKETGSDSSLSVITKIAHEVFDLFGMKADSVEIYEAVKDLCARSHIPYARPPDIVRRAIESARWQREHRSSAS